MPKYQTSRRVRHTPEAMFALVADVERYPEFVPLCDKLVVRRRAKGDDGTETLLADMTVAYKFLRETFTSKVVLDPARSEIRVAYIDGPFHHLDNRWTFAPAGEEGCEVRFFIDYEFKSRTLGLLMGSVFDAAFRRFAEAFERRADTVYGTKPA